MGIQRSLILQNGYNNPGWLLETETMFTTIHLANALKETTSSKPELPLIAAHVLSERAFKGMGNHAQ